MSKTNSQSSQILPTDRVLSVRQPYAQLLLTGSKRNPGVPIKWCENRSWQPESWLSGKRILIHASGTIDRDEAYRGYGLKPASVRHSAILGHALLVGAYQFRGCSSDPWSDEYQKLFKQHCLFLREVYEDKTGCCPLHGTKHIEMSRGVWHWLFADPVLLDEPIPCPGKLRIWTFPANLK